MDCLLRPRAGPNEPIAALPKVSLVARQRWDGGPFLTYPLRRGLSDMYFGAGGTTEHPWEIRQGAHKTPTAELEAFFQEWLFFGLIVEALDGNSETTSSSHLPAATQQTGDEPAQQHDDLPAHRQKQTIISRVYKEFVYQADDRSSYITTKTFLAELHDSWAISLLSFHSSRNRLAVRCKRMRQCLRQARYFYFHLPVGFGSDIRFAIGAVAETIAHAMQPVCHWLKLEDLCPDQWGDGYYQWSVVRTRMREGGWSLSDLDRTVNKFKFLHTLHYLSFLDKRNPARSHTSCTESEWLATDPNATGESRNHWQDGCSCPEVELDQHVNMNILRKGKAVPLLVFNEVQKQDLKPTEQKAEASSEEVPQISIEVVSSTDSTAYVAISHIWSDGLGNAQANSLNACKLRELRRMVQALPLLATTTEATETDDTPSAESGENCPLIWLDTLCCPVNPDDKKLALAKMRRVYEEASSVLVLDASLKSHSSTSMDVLEVLSRIFTSRWLRRVWTLQEGALAKNLWFQFADKALSLAELKATMDAIWLNNLQQKVIFSDIRYEIDRIEQFFQNPGYDQRGPNLKLLDEALMHRGITNPSDEPLCIGTLMNLPAEAVLAPGDDIIAALGTRNGIEDAEQLRLQLKLRNLRMETVWKLLAEKFGSIPAQIIFFEEARLEAKGFRWAPQSLLDVQQVYLNPTLRKVTWDDQNPGILTGKGLKVKYPGYRLYLAQYDDGKPRHPWQGRKRPPEENIVFRDVATGEWYSVATKQRAKQVRDESADITNPSAFPLHDFIHQNSNSNSNQKDGTTSRKEAFLLMSEIEQGETPHSEKNAVDGILMIGTFQQEEKENSPEMTTAAGSPPVQKAILAVTHHHVIVAPLPTALSSLYNTAETLALQLREEECTDDLLLALAILHSRSESPVLKPEDDETYKAALRDVEQRMKDLMAEALKQDDELKLGLRKTWGDDIDEYLWVFVGDWFQHAFLGERVGDGEQEGVWIVD